MTPGLAIRRAVPAMAYLVMVGCAGNGNGLDASGRPLGSGGGGGALTADYESIQSNVFTPICTVCHAGGGAPQGLRLDAANAFTLLVGIPSTEAPSIPRVAPGNPDGSYLIQKLEGHAAVGAQMPFGGPPLPGSTIAVIRQWITDGATRGVAAAAMPLTIDAVVPAAGEVLPSPPQIVVSFNRELDATRLQAGTLRLEREDVDVWVPVAARLAMVRTARALVLTPVRRLEAGRYRVLLDGEPAAALLDLAGNALAVGVGEAGATPLSVFVVGQER